MIPTDRASFLNPGLCEIVDVLLSIPGFHMLGCSGQYWRVEIGSVDWFGFQVEHDGGKFTWNYHGRVVDFETAFDMLCKETQEVIIFNLDEFHGSKIFNPGSLKK